MNCRILKSIPLFLVGILFSLGLNARVALPAVFSDNMVLQQKTQAAIWGKAAAGKTVTVTTSWNSKKYIAVTDSKENWKLKVQTPGFGGPYTITISDGEVTTLSNVLIGEVWICSGQSNMEMPLAGWGKIKDYENEIAAADYPNIRLLQAEHVTSNKPLDDAKVTNGGWTPCTPKYVADFSSVAYFFAREIYQQTKIPIGLIHTSWGGTIAEAWTSGSTLSTMADFKNAVNSVASSATDNAKQTYENQMAAWQKSIVEKDSGYAAGNAVWTSPATTTSNWQSMDLPNKWENTSLPDFDGVVWFRKKINLPASWEGKELTISLGTIDDDDITWLNGEKIGETIGYNKQRNYTVNGNLVKAGENEIVVRVFDGSGAGGFYDEPANLHLSVAGEQPISLVGSWLYKVGINAAKLNPKPMDMEGPNRTMVLYNAMIHPFIQFSIRGAIWYQGESNAGRAYQYRSLFPMLIKDWRKNFNQGDFPFYFVQLANFMKAADKPEASEWAELREAQLQTLSLPNTGMAVAIDIGEAEDIHPKNKQEVGRRLALLALAKIYGKTVSSAGPVYASFAKQQDKIILNFKNPTGGLMAKKGDALSGFEIAGADKIFYTAKAVIAGDRVIVSSTEVADAQAVRYDWANNPNGNLYNNAGLPASPFRTDSWQGITYGKK